MSGGGAAATRVRRWLRTRTGRLVVHDAVVAAGAGYAVYETSGGGWTAAALTAAGMVTLKTFLRLVLPAVPGWISGKTVATRRLDAGGIIPGDGRRVLVGERGPEAVIPLRQRTGLRVISTPERRKRGKRLGRHIEHDERSRAYSVIARDLATLRSVRHHRRAGVFDQGNVGSCTGNAMAGALCTAPFRHRFTASRALKLYELATELDGFPGVYPPDDTGSSGLAVAKAAQRQGYISSYLHCFTLEAVLTALQDGPVILGVNWHDGFDNPAADGRMAFAGGIRGGHEICADEINVEHQRVWITNSWGPGWGVNGRAYWTWPDLRAVLADSGDAVVPKA